MKRVHLFISLCLLHTLSHTTLAQISSSQTINFSTADNTNLGPVANDGEGGSTDISGVQIDIFEIDASGNPTGNDLIYNANDIGFGGVIEEGISISTDPSLTSWRGISIKTNDGSEFDFNGFESWELSFAGTVTFTVEGFKDGVSTGSTTTTSASGDRQEHGASEFSDAIFGEVDEVRIIATTDFYGTFDVFLLGAATQPNSVPTFTAFSGPVETTTEDTGVEISFADLAAVGDEADGDGFVEQFAVQSVTSGALTINGAPYDPVFNFLINVDFTATWTPPAGQTGTLNAFTVKAVDNQGAESTTAVQATVTVNSAAAAPSVTTSAATSLTATTATLNGDVTSDGNETITERGFVYAKTSDDATPTVAEANGTTVIKVTVSGTTGTFNTDLTGLTAGTSFSFIAYATNSEGTTEGSVQTFTTSNPTVAFASTSSSGAESVSSANLQVDLSSASSQTITVSYSVAGTATGNGTDFTLANGTLTFAASETSKNISIAGIVDDAILEADETVIVTLSNPTNASLGTNTVHTYTITNNDAAAVTIADVSTNEDDGAITVTATLDNAVAGGFTVEVSTADGTATTADEDYTAVTETLTFTGTAGESQTFTITPKTDTKLEANETLTVSMGNLGATSLTVDITDGGTITISNDDAAAVTIADVSANEDDGVIMVTATLDNAVDGGFTVEVSTADGTATAGVDYTAVTGETLTFAGTAGETQTFTITPTSDSDIEDDETLTVSMSNLGATSLPVDITDGATITIDNDDAAVLTIADVSGNEDDGPIAIIVTLDIEVQGGFTVDIGTTNGTARTDDQDYTAEVGRLTFAGTAGETQIFNITPTADTKLEANETFTVSMGDLAATSFPVDISDVATVTILNDDAAAVTIADVSGNEDDGAITVTATLDNAVQGGFTVDVYTADGTATTADGDYTAVTETLTFTGTAGETQTFTITPTTDTKLEANETLTVSMGNLGATSLTVDITDGGTITINNDDVAAVTIGDVSGNEDDGSITVTATLNNAVAGGFTVDVSTADGSATTADGDYIAVTSETLTFAGTAGETQTFVISPTSDSDIEDDETLTVSMSNLGGTALPVDITDEATITIVNDDFPNINFTSIASSGAESTSSADITVSLSAAISSVVTVDYTVTGTATGGGIDYTLANGTLTFNASETSKNITIASIVDDIKDEQDETVIITLSNPSNAQLGTNNIHTYTILDNDPFPSISFASSGSSGEESVASAAIEVVISPESSKVISIDYAVTGTATGNGTDYTLANGTLFFNASETSKNITITSIIDDAIYEVDETVIVTLSNPTNATLGSNVVHIYTILDNDNTAPEFTSTPEENLTEGEDYSYIIATSDVDGDEVTVTGTTIPEWLSLERTLSYHLASKLSFSQSVAGKEVVLSDIWTRPADYEVPVSPGIAIDASDNLYLTDVQNHQILKIAPNGQVTVVAGSGSIGNADGNGTAASFNTPMGIDLDASGNIYVADAGNHNIRKITPNGDVTTIAGSGSFGFTEGNGANAKFNTPIGLALDAENNIYVADVGNHRVRKITPSGDVITLAGSGNRGSVDGNGPAAGFQDILCIAVDSEGNVYVSEEVTLTGGSHRKITPNGDVTTMGTLQYRFTALAVDASDNLYGVNTGSSLVKIDADGTETSLNPQHEAGSMFRDHPSGLVIDGSGHFILRYFNDDTNEEDVFKVRPVFEYGLSGNSSGYPGDHEVVLRADDGRRGITEQSFTINVNSAPEFTSTPTYEIGLKAAYNYDITTSDPDGDEVTVTAPTLPEWLSLQSCLSPYAVSTFAGSGYRASDDGNGTSAGFNLPTGVAIDDSGNIYVADSENQKIRKITPTGEVTTLAGSGSRGNSDGIGEAASFNNPSGVAVDASGNVYVADQINHSIRKITPNGHVTTLAGSGTRGKTDGNGLSASFQNPYGIATDASGNVYVADAVNNRIRKITPNGDVTTLAGSSNGSTDGNGSSASFKTPFGVAVDVLGNVYVADFGNHKIRKITPNGDVTTLAGSGSPGSADGNGTAASFNNPSGISVDAQGNVYVGDRGNNKIRKITPDGDVTTIAGSGSTGSADGDGTAASFYNPDGLAVDGNGYIYVADYRNHIIRKISLPTTIYSLAGTSPEFNGDYDVVLKADDGRGGITEQSFTITVLNEAPTDITLDVTQITENNAVNDKIGDLSTVDANSGDTHTYTLVSGTGDTDNGQFKIEAGAVVANAVFNFEEKSSYSIRVRTTDVGDLTFEKTFTITIVDANDAPTAISTSSEASIIENSEVETVVTTFTTTDEDAGDSHTYTLVAGDGDADNASFTIEGDALQVAEVFDFETKSSYSIRIRSTDLVGSFVEQALTIVVTNEPEASIVAVSDGDFGLTVLGFTSTKTWTLTNNGDRNTEIIVTSTDQAFKIVPGSVIVPAGESKEITASFLPSEVKAYQGVITLSYVIVGSKESKVFVNVFGEGTIVTEIQDPSILNRNVEVYPNPASEQLTIDISNLDTERLDISIIGSEGQGLWNRKEVMEKQITVDISNYANGLYILLVTDGQTVIRKKIIIKH